MARVSGTKFQGPLLGSDRAMAGLIEDAEINLAAKSASNFKTYFEPFNHTIVDATAFGELGATATAVGAVAANTIVGASSRALLINPGTAADTGWEVQFNAASSQATYVNNRFDIMGPITAASNNMQANREFFFYARFGLQSNATTWDGKALLGWFFTDTSLLSPTTGLPTVAAGGGVGFHIGEDGVISYVSDDAAITAAGSTIESVGTLTASTVKWYECGFRAKVTTFASQIGTVDFYFGKNGSMQKVASTLQNGTFPCANASAYSVSLACLNGPTNQADLHIDQVITGINRISSL